MPRHHFLLAPAAQPPATVRVWFDLYWGRLHWVARCRGPGGSKSLRGSVITSMPRTFLSLLRGLVEQEVRSAAALLLPQVAVRPATAARLLPTSPVPVPWTIKRTLAHPPMPPAAPHGSWWPRAGAPFRRRTEARP